MSKKFPWLARQKKSGIEVPLEPPVWMGNHSNGEYWHEQTPKEKLMRDMILERAETESRKRGIDRREFLASTAGMLATMGVINQLAGCGDDGKTQLNPDGSVGGGNAIPVDGPLVKEVPASCDPADVLAGDEFIFDIQTHSFDDGEWREKQPAYVSFLGLIGGNCDEANQLDCFDKEHYAELMFVQSETTMAVITSWPGATCTKTRTNGCGLPLSNDGMRDLRDWLNEKARSQRVVNQVQIMPNDDIELQKDIMSMAVEDPDWRAVSWKAYPAWKSDTYKPDGYPSGYFLTDKIGRQFIEHGLSLGINNFAIHKGLPIPGFDVEHNKTTDVGPMAKMHPEANLIIYHSGISAGCDSNKMACGAFLERKPFDPSNENPLGLDMLLKSLLDEELITEEGPTKGLNVYAELGSAWSNVMRDAIASQHFMGKLLKYVGEDNICWGTDCILGGSPQEQIEMFRAFEITPQFQEMFGYPAITKAMKAKIFGLNAARLYRVDPEAERCKLDKNALAQYKKRADEELGGRRFTQIPPLGPRTRREFIDSARIAMKKRHPGCA